MLVKSLEMQTWTPADLAYVYVYVCVCVCVCVCVSVCVYVCVWPPHTTTMTP